MLLLHFLVHMKGSESKLERKKNVGDFIGPNEPKTSKRAGSKIHCAAVHGVEHHLGKWISIRFDWKYTEKHTTSSVNPIRQCKHLKVLYSPWETQLILLDV